MRWSGRHGKAKPPKTVVRSPDTPLDAGLPFSGEGDRTASSPTAALAYTIDPTTDDIVYKLVPVDDPVEGVLAIWDSAWFGLDDDGTARMWPGAGDAPALPNAIHQLPPLASHSLHCSQHTVRAGLMPRHPSGGSLATTSPARSTAGSEQPESPFAARRQQQQQQQQQHSPQALQAPPARLSPNMRHLHAAGLGPAPAFTACEEAAAAAADAGLAALPLATIVASLPGVSQPLPAMRSSSEQDADAAHPILGTWAQRLFRLPLPPRAGSVEGALQRRGSRDLGQQHQLRRSSRELPGRQQTQPAAASKQRSIPTNGSSRAGGGGGAAGAPDEEEVLMQAAWRWRFARRWQAEQARVLDPAAAGAAASAGDCDLDDTLAFLAACGGGGADAARTSSTDTFLVGAGESSHWELSHTAGTPSMLLAAEDSNSLPASCSASAAGGLLLSAAGGTARGAARARAAGATSGPAPPPPREQPQQTALHELRQLQRRAAEVLATQERVERSATERWAGIEAGGAAAWLGAAVEAVAIDDWGRFAFVLLRLSDRSGRTKLLVRGANNAGEAALLDSARREVAGASNAHSLPLVPLQLVGGGTMEWRRHTDRQLHISSGYTAPPGGGGPRAGPPAAGPMTSQEVMNLACVLTKQALPCHYRVSVEGGRML